MLCFSDSHGIFFNNCVEFHRLLVQEYGSTLETVSLRQNYSTRSPNDSQHLSPFGTSPRDWTRLILLRDALPEDSTIRKNFKHLFTILLVAHDQALKTNSSSQQQEVVNSFEKGKTVSSSHGKNTILQISLDTESHFENSVSTPKMNDTIKNDTIVKLQSNGKKNFLRNPRNSTLSSVSISSSEAVEKNLTSPSEKARKIVGLTSFDLVVTKIPLIGKKESEESATPEHFLNSNEQSSEPTRDETLCNRSSNAQDYVQPFRNDRSGLIENEKIHHINSPENEKIYSLQSSTSMNLRTTTLIPKQKNAKETLQDSTTSRSFHFETISPDELSISREQENARRDSAHFSGKFSSPRTFTNNQSLSHQFLTMTQNSGLSRSTGQQLGTSSWIEYSTETEEYSSAKISSSTSTPSILISAPSEGLATEEEQVQKYPWKIANDSISKIKSPMTTPTFLISTSKRNGIKKVSKPRESWLEDRIPTEASIVNFESNINPSPLPSPQENQFRAKEEKMEKSNDTNFSTKLKTNLNNLKASVSNKTKADSTSEAYGRYGEDCKSRTQESSSVSQAEQTEMTGNSWTTIFPNERGSIILETSNKNDEIKTMNFSDQMENSYSAKSISNKSKLLTESSIFADNEKNFEDVQSPNYKENIKIPEVSRHLSIRNKPKTDNLLNNSPSSSPEKPKIIETPLQNENSMERHDYGVEQRIKDTVTVTVPSETSSPSIPREPSIPLPKESFVKNAVRPNLSKNDEISRDYKHDIKDFAAARKNLEARPRNVYEFGVSAKNRSFWRQKLEQNLTASDIRRFEWRKGNSKPINIDEKSSNDTESNVPITKESNDSSESLTHGRINELRPRKRDSENGEIEQQFSWFYRQGQTEDRSKSR